MSEVDYQLALLLQHQFQQELKKSKEHKSDLQLAVTLQEQFQKENEIDKPKQNLVYDNRKQNKNALNSSKSLTDPSWEVIDPTPDIHMLFIAFNERFFWNKLLAVCVSWSKRMTSCAGICSYQGRGGMCSITLSEPLLKLRPRKDMVETLLHEMIHAYLFVTHNNRDRDGHGPEFHKHMYRINGEAGTNITVYHDFHDEVKLYQQHWWRCNGPCQNRKPFFGMVRRAMNRAPGPQDRWWGDHSRNCGGDFKKVREPEKPPKREGKKGTNPQSGKESNKSKTDIRNYISSSSTSNVTKPAINTPTNTNIHTISNSSNSNSKISTVIPSKVNNIFGFGNLNGSSNASSSGRENFKGAVRNNSNTIVINKKPSTVTKSDNEIKSVSSTPSEKGSNSTVNNENVDYSAVRNHWINKFSNSSTDQHGVKRNLSNESQNSQVKVPKLSLSSPPVSISSNLSGDQESAECPVCARKIPLKELNDHLDMCLATPKKVDEKECIICERLIPINDYERHVMKCSEDAFNDDVFEEPSEKGSKKCSFCGKHISDNYDDHILECSSSFVDNLENSSDKVVDLTCDNIEEKPCSVCDKMVLTTDYNKHVEKCLLKMYDDMEASYDIKEEHVDCLACGRKIKRSELDSHLEECMSMSRVFEDDTEPKEAEVIDADKENKYNCPFCMKLILESDMNSHIDICLDIVDCSSQSKRNKNVLLESFLSDDF